MGAGKVTIREAKEGVLIEVRVRTNSNRFALTRKEGRLVLEVTSQPREGEANAEIVKGLKRLFGHDVEIVHGLKGKDKVILIKNSKMPEIEALL
ncbi:MAG: DUF167 domain-containing protein [Candidatus Aenigmatarchaeota archaeon]